MAAVNRKYLQSRLASAVHQHPAWDVPGYSTRDWLVDVKSERGRRSYGECAAERLMRCSRGMTMDEMMLMFRPMHHATWERTGRSVVEAFRVTGEYRISGHVRRSGAWYAIMHCFMDLQPFGIFRQDGTYVVSRCHRAGEPVFIWSPQYGIADDQAGAGSAAPAEGLSREGDALPDRQ